MQYSAVQRARQAFTVPATSGDYAEQEITFGASASGLAQGALLGVTAVIETIPANARVELWLSKVSTTADPASAFATDDYFYAGLVLVPARTSYSATGETASYGSATWPLAAYPSAKLRIRSGGTSGGATISASAD
jgi:hypothetical protein